ncbi:MAG: hypothetical protein V3V49_12900 [Candidatus Krumholzibacteria bacterium]
MGKAQRLIVAGLLLGFLIVGNPGGSFNDMPFWKPAVPRDVVGDWRIIAVGVDDGFASRSDIVWDLLLDYILPTRWVPIDSVLDWQPTTVEARLRIRAPGAFSYTEFNADNLAVWSKSGTFQASEASEPPNQSFTMTVDRVQRKSVIGEEITGYWESIAPLDIVRQEGRYVVQDAPRRLSLCFEQDGVYLLYELEE